MEKITDSALLPANVYVAPKEERFQDTFRRWQGIPSVEVTPLSLESPSPK